MLTNSPAAYCGSFGVIGGSFGYLQTTLTRSTKPFKKRLSSCGGRSIFIFDFLPFFLLTNSPAAYCGSFGIIGGSFGYLQSTRTRSTIPFTKRLRSHGGKSILFPTFYTYADQLLKTLLWFIWYHRGLVWIPRDYLNTLHKSVHIAGIGLYIQ